MSQNANPAATFRREDRYIVIKRSDLKKVPVNYRSALVDPMFSLLSHLPNRECLVIESDWPEFEPAWAAIETRVTGKNTEQPQGEPVALPARKPWNGLLPTADNLKGEGYNACIDEIAKLGPLYTRPAQGEPVAYLITPPGCSPALVFARDIRSVNVYTAPLYTHAEPAEVERLRDENRRLHEAGEFLDGVNQGIEDTLRAQLAERDALLHSLDCAWNSHDGKERFGKLMRKVETLAASAEPCAAVEVDHDALVAAVCVLRSQGLGNLSAAVEEARTALERKPS